MPSISRFLLDTPLAGPGAYVLGRQESHHAISVLRHRLDDAVIVFDGQGRYADAVITDVQRDAVAVRVDVVRDEEHLPLFLTIATAIPKGKRWQVLVEKCTELGVDRIIPIHTIRGVAKGEGDLGKWRRWVVEAAKQSRRAWLPEIIEPLPFAKALDMARGEGAFLLVADPAGEPPQNYRGQLSGCSRVTAIIGPEGGFADAELEECRARGVHGICLSPFILRIETAAAAVCAIVREMLL